MLALSNLARARSKLEISPSLFLAESTIQNQCLLAQVVTTGLVSALCSTTQHLVQAGVSWALPQTPAHTQSWHLFPHRKMNWYWTNCCCCCNKIKVKSQEPWKPWCFHWLWWFHLNRFCLWPLPLKQVPGRGSTALLQPITFRKWKSAPV